MVTGQSVNTGEAYKDSERISLFLFFFSAITATYWITELRFQFMREYDVASVKRLMEGTAMTPFQYRALFPWLMRLVGGIIDLGNGQLLSNFLFWMEFSNLLLASISIKLYVKNVTNNDRLSNIMGILFFTSIPFLNFFTPLSRLYYPSDIPSIYFMAFGLLFLLQKKWLLYYIILIIGTFNRETTLFLVIAYIATQFNSLDNKQFYKSVGLQLVIWSGIKIGLWLLYHGNNGAGAFSLYHNSELSEYTISFLNSRFYSNLMMFSQMKDASSFTSIGAFLLIPSIYYALQLNNSFVKRTLWVFPIFFGIMLLVGNLNEFRIYGELIPLIWGIVGATISESIT